MKKDEIPQDLGELGKITGEVCYVVDDAGNYSTVLSNGWEVKSTALDIAWKDVEHRISAASEKVSRGDASPILFFMELRLMDTAIVSAYTGFWKWQVKKHLQPTAFKKLSEKKLQRYADLFEVNLEELKTMKVHEG